MWNDDDAIAVVAAHPDDETIGAGGQLWRMTNVTLIHVTDGAPRSRADWKCYAQTRRQEFLRAAEIAAIPAERCLEVGLADQEASRHLVELSSYLSRLFADLDPRIILTHSFEGGHPDHDATAFAVHHAAHRARLIEFASYHRASASAGIETGCFLGDSHDAIRVALEERQKSVKRAMLDCFVSQRETLNWFRADQECFRPAPEYDFTGPPHAGRLFYESYDWGVNASQWLQLARRAERLIGPCLSR